MKIVVFLEDADCVHQVVSCWTVDGVIFKTLQDKRTQGMLRFHFIKVLAPTKGLRHHAPIYNKKEFMEKSWQIMF